MEMWRDLQRRNAEMVNREEGEGEGEIEMYRGSGEERIREGMEISRGVRIGLEGKGPEEMERERSRCIEDMGRR